MKNVMMICIALLGFTVSAQPGPPKNHGPKAHMEKMADLTPEQIAELKTKELTLKLDLNESQQAEVHKINLAEAIKMKEMMENRKDKKERTETAHFEAKKEKLDDKIEVKKKMKSILSETQYAKWEEGLQRRMKHKKHGKRANKH